MVVERPMKDHFRRLSSNGVKHARAPFKVASSRLFWVSEAPYQITCGS